MFLMCSGFEKTNEIKRDVSVGACDSIILHGYFDKVPYIEGILNCQVSEIDQSIDKLKELGRVIKESLDN